MASRATLKWVMSRVWVMKHMNGSCYVWKSHAGQAFTLGTWRAEPHVNESCHIYESWFIWMSHIKYESRTIFSRCTTSRATYEWDISHIWVMAHKNESSHMWMNHAPFALGTWRAEPNVNESCHIYESWQIWMSHVTYEKHIICSRCTTSRAKVGYFQLTFAGRYSQKSALWCLCMVNWVVSWLFRISTRCTTSRVCCSVLQCVAVCCSVLQCVAACCSVLLQCVAVCCSVLQCAVAVCCSVLRCVNFYLSRCTAFRDSLPCTTPIKCRPERALRRSCTNFLLL